MRITVVPPNFADLTRGIEGDLAASVTGAMEETTPGAVAELREQVRSNGLGARLANTWRGRVYPDQGGKRGSLAAAGYVWTRAPEIIDSFVRGATIVPVNGSRYLAIPTDNVPHAGGRRGATSRMTPVQVEIAYDQDLIVKRGKNGHLLAFVNVLSARNGRGYRPGTARRLAQGRQLKLVLMFTLVPVVRMPKLLDLDGPAKRWAAAFEAALGRWLAR